MALSGEWFLWLVLLGYLLAYLCLRLHLRQGKGQAGFRQDRAGIMPGVRHPYKRRP
jgi:hypothetical protein